MKMYRMPELEAVLGKKRSSLYNDIKAGLLPQPVKLGSSAAGWPNDEIESVLRARIAGKTEGDIRALVTRIHADRQALA